MPPKGFLVWFLFFLLLESSCLSKAAKINLRNEIRHKYEEIENISARVFEFIESCALDAPRIYGLETMERSIGGVCSMENEEPVDCLNDIIFHIKNMPNFEDSYCNVTCQSKASETVEMLLSFREHFNVTVGTCNDSLSGSEENPLHISCSECSPSDLFWQGLALWTDNLTRMLESLESGDFDNLQSTCNKEHSRRRKAAAKKAKEEKKLRRQEKKKKQAERRKREQQRAKQNRKASKGKENRKNTEQL